MGIYVHPVQDFILRTQCILKQYKDYVQPKVGERKSYEVTLLMNCLMGLLVVPQQIASRQDYQSLFNDWLTKEIFQDVAPQWGLDPKFLHNPGTEPDWEKLPNGCKKRVQVPYNIEDFSMRNLIKQMRNTAAHANVKLLPDKMQDYPVTITDVEFKELNSNGQERPDGFHLIIPVQSLHTFVNKLADSALTVLIENRNNQRDINEYRRLLEVS